MTARYDSSHLSEDQYEPGSDESVLKNLMGITTRDDMEVFETGYLWSAERQLIEQVKEDQTFKADEKFSAVIEKTLWQV